MTTQLFLIIKFINKKIFLENDNNISPQTSQVSARSDEKLKSIQIINELLTKEDVLDKDETLSDADESESTIDDDDDESGIDQSALFENVSVQDEYLIQKEKGNNFNHHQHKTQSCSKLPDANVEIISNHLSLTNTYTLPNTYIKYKNYLKNFTFDSYIFN